MVQALVTSFEEASRKDLRGSCLFQAGRAHWNSRISPAKSSTPRSTPNLKYKIPAESVITKPDQWKNLMDMQVYLGNAKGTIAFDQIIDNSFAEKAIAAAK